MATRHHLPAMHHRFMMFCDVCERFSPFELTNDSDESASMERALRQFIDNDIITCMNRWAKTRSELGLKQIAAQLNLNAPVNYAKSALPYADCITIPLNPRRLGPAVEWIHNSFCDSWVTTLWMAGDIMADFGDERAWSFCGPSQTGESKTGRPMTALTWTVMLSLFSVMLSLFSVVFWMTLMTILVDRIHRMFSSRPPTLLIWVMTRIARRRMMVPDASSTVRWSASMPLGVRKIPGVLESQCCC